MNISINTGSDDKIMHHVVQEGTDEHSILEAAASKGNGCPVFKGVIKLGHGFALNEKDVDGSVALVVLSKLIDSGTQGNFFLAVEADVHVGMIIKICLTEVTSGRFRAAYHSADGRSRLIIRPELPAEPKIFLAWGRQWHSWRERGLPDSLEAALELVRLGTRYYKSPGWRLNKCLTVLFFIPYICAPLWEAVSELLKARLGRR